MYNVTHGIDDKSQAWGLILDASRSIQIFGPF